MLSPFIISATFLFFISGSFGFDSLSELKVVNILLKPFGVRLQPDIHKTTSLNCTGHLQELRACNNTLLHLLNSTTSSEEVSVNSLIESCNSGRYKCLQQQVSRNQSVLQGWLKKFKVALHRMCWDQCWKIYLAVDKDCLHSPMTASQTVHFTHKVLEAFCHKPRPAHEGEVSYCTDLFVKGLFSQVDKEECNVKKAIEDKRCSSSCYQEIYDFYSILGSCVSVVTDTMKKYSVSPSPGTFGIIIQNGTVMCGKNQPKSFTKPTSSSTTLTPKNNETLMTTNESPAAGPSSLSGKLIAAIVVAVSVFGIAGVVLCRYAYQRFMNKPKLRFEDYGYSHLQMMQDQEDFYNNYDEDDHGLLDL